MIYHKRAIVVNYLTKSATFAVFIVSVPYNLYTNVYQGLYLAYKPLLTLAVSQVSRERTFSK